MHSILIKRNPNQMHYKPQSMVGLNFAELQTNQRACTQTPAQIPSHKETHQSTSRPDKVNM